MSTDPSAFSIRSRVDSGRKALRRPEYETSQRATTRRTAPHRTVRFGQDSEPLDAGAADDGVAAVVEAHPRLAPAVVVGRPDDEDRVAAADAAGLRPLRLDAAPDADERVLLPLAADRRLLSMAGKDERL